MIPEEIACMVRRGLSRHPVCVGGLKFGLIFHLHSDLVYTTGKTVQLTLLGKLNKLELLASK